MLMYLHSILQGKTHKWLKVNPRPGYSGMTVLQRINAKCAEAKRAVDMAPPQRCVGVRNEDTEVLHRERVEAGGWTRLGLFGSAG